MADDLPTIEGDAGPVESQGVTVYKPKAQGGAAVDWAAIESGPAKQDTANTSLASIDTKMSTLAGYVDGLEGFTDGLEGVLGTTAGAAVITDANGTIQQYLRGLIVKMLALITAIGSPFQAGEALGAGTAEIGRTVKGQQTVTDCVISNTASLSAAVDLSVYRLVGIAIPGIFEPTTLTFQSSYDGTTYNNVYDSSGTEKSVTVAIGRRVILSPADFYGIRWIKVRGGTNGSPTVVAADRTLKLIAEG